MSIDWWALVLVALVSIAMTVVFVVLLSAGIRCVVTGRAASASRGGSATMTVSAGYALLTLAGLLVLFGLYLIIPQLH